MTEQHRRQPAPDRARKREIRERMAATGEPYSVAARRIGANTTAADPLPAEERGVAALPAAATPEQRAHAEAVWRATTDPDQPCRCSGPCHHGEPCDDDSSDDRCPGRVVHADRYPGSLFAVTAWQDEYVCLECESAYTTVVELPALPWAERTERGTVLFDGTRHPNFPETHPGFDENQPVPDGDGLCRACGGYAFAGLLCDGCRADGWTDDYGMVAEPDHDDELHY